MATTPAPTEAGAPFYPRPLFHYSPTFTAPLPLTAHDIHSKLTAHPLFAGQNILHHGNHPVHVVRVVGLLVALDTYDVRHGLVLDDASGDTIDAVIWRNRRQEVPVELPDGAVVGAVVGVEGVVSVFRGVRQVEVRRLWVLRDTAEEVAAWAQVLDVRRGVLSRPWVLEERVLERERREAEREARAVVRAVAAAEGAFVGRRRAPRQTFEVVVPPVQRGSPVADGDGQGETPKERAPNVIKYIGHRRPSKPPEAPVEPPRSTVGSAPEPPLRYIGHRRPSRPPEVPTPDPEPVQPAPRYMGHKRTSRPPEVPPIFESPAPPPAAVVLVQATPPTFVGHRRTSRPPEVPVGPVPDPVVKFIGRRRASRPPEEPPEPPLKQEPVAVVVPKYIGHRRTGSKLPEPPAQEPTTAVVAPAHTKLKRPKPLEPAPAEAMLKYAGQKRSTVLEPPYRALKRMRPLPEDGGEPAGSGHRGQKRQKLPGQPFSSSPCSGGSGSHRRPSTKAAPPPPPEASSSVFRGKRRAEQQHPPVLPASQVPQELLDSICLSSPASPPAEKASPPPPLRRGRSSGMHEAAPPSAQPQPQYRGRRRHPSTRISEQSTPLTPVGPAKPSSAREPARRVRREKGGDTMTSSMESAASTSTRCSSGRYGTRSMASSSQEGEQRRSRKRSSRARSSQEEAAYVPSGRRRSEEDPRRRRTTRSSQEEAAYVPSGRRRGEEEEDGERRRTRSSQESEHTEFRGKRRAGALVNIKKPAVTGGAGFVGKRRSTTTTTAESSGGGGGKRRKLAPELGDEKEKAKERAREEEDDEENRLLAAIEQSPYVPTPPPGVKQKQGKKEEPAPTPTPTMKPKTMFLGRRRSTLLQLEDISDFSDYVPSPADTAPNTAPTTANIRAPANPAPPVVSRFVGKRRK